MLTSAPVALTLNVLESLANPTASGGLAADNFQLQNASPFILNVSAGGELYSIQSWTAQTIPLASDGVNPTVLPISGPSGTQGSMTAVWLLPGQSPPMEDGQLTGAAQYAQGLGQILLEPTTTNYPVTGPPTFTVPVPPTVRTLVLTITSVIGAVDLVTITGNVSGFVYYNTRPYLIIGTALQCMVVCPIIATVDSSVDVTLVAVGGTTSIETTIAGDSALYQESEFYNGIPAPTYRGTAGTFVTGPCRLISASLEEGPASIAVGGIQVMSNNSAAGSGANPAQMSFPQPNIVPVGTEITLITSSGAPGSVVTAYP